MEELPGLTQQPLQYVDGTPNEGYPLRILQAYRQLCNSKWVETTSYGSMMDVRNPLLKQMNDDCEKRAEILDRAIAKLVST